MTRRILMVVGTAGLLVTAGHAQAGFLDDFARAFIAPASRQIVNFNPLEMTVKKPRRRSTQSIELSSRPAPVVKLDPITDSSWFLRDPTLRRGDIVVTGSGVLVYQGRDSYDLNRRDFAELGGGKVGSGNWRQQLKSAAHSGRSFFSSPGSTSPARTAEATAY